jgi:NADH dehydrogenase
MRSSNRIVTMLSTSRLTRHGGLTLRVAPMSPSRALRTLKYPRSQLIPINTSHHSCFAPKATQFVLPRRLPHRRIPSQQFIQIRFLSTAPLPSHRGPVVRFLYRTFAYTGLFIVACGTLVVAFFIYDASTYKEADPVGDCPVSTVALAPARGGPKNLPIATSLLDDESTPDFAAQKDKPKLVILGTGWGSIALLKTLNTGDYHVTVVSPVNYFLFTPMLPSATVGTLEFRSLIEPVRRIINRLRGHFLRAEAEGIEFSEKLVEISQTDSEGKKQHFYLPYDKLVIGVGT